MVIFGLISTGLAYAVSVHGGTVIQSMLSFTAAIGAPTTAMFLMGIMLPFVNGKVTLKQYSHKECPGHFSSTVYRLPMSEVQVVKVTL